MTTHTVHIKESLVFGWKTFKSSPWLFIAVPLVLMAISTGIGMLEHLLSFIFGAVEMRLLINLESAVTTVLMSTGIIYLYLKAHDAVQTAELRDLWFPRPFWRYIGVSIVGGAAIILGLILLVVPGVILALAFSFAGVLVVEKGLGPIEALKESTRLTKGHRLQLFKLSLATIGINLLGLCALFVGLFVTVPVTQLALVHAYRELSKGHATPEVSAGS